MKNIIFALTEFRFTSPTILLHSEMTYQTLHFMIFRTDCYLFEVIKFFRNLLQVIFSIVTS